jgi:hypothetical protein
MAEERRAFEARCAEFEAKRAAEVGRIVSRQALVRRVLECAAVRQPGLGGRCAHRWCCPMLPKAFSIAARTRECLQLPSTLRSSSACTASHAL